jgi:hypothetical protein
MLRWRPNRGHRFTSLAAGLGDGEHVFIDCGGAAAASLRLGGAQPVQGPFADQVAFHFRGHCGHHEQHLAGDRGPVGAVQPGADPGQDVRVDAAGVLAVSTTTSRQCAAASASSCAWWSWVRVLTRA